jgi:hypothetical protein
MSSTQVNDKAEVCPDFAKGHCPLGKACKRKHVHAKPAAAADKSPGFEKRARDAGESPERAAKRVKEAQRAEAELAELFGEGPCCVCVCVCVCVGLVAYIRSLSVYVNVAMHTHLPSASATCTSHLPPAT